MTDAVMLNFYHWCKTPFNSFSKKFSAMTPNFLHVFGRAPSESTTVLCTKLWHRLRDIRLLSIL